MAAAAEPIIPLVTLYSSETNAFFSDVPSDYLEAFLFGFSCYQIVSVWLAMSVMDVRKQDKHTT
jgi:hypothetical protein